MPACEHAQKFLPEDNIKTYSSDKCGHAKTTRENVGGKEEMKWIPRVETFVGVVEHTLAQVVKDTLLIGIRCAVGALCDVGT